MTYFFFNRKMYCLALILILFSLPKLQAQKPKLDILPIQVITEAETKRSLEARTFTIGNLTETILRVPGTRALVQRNSVYNYNLSGGGKRTDMILIDGQDNPYYIRSITTNQAAIPVEAIEEIRVLNTIQQGNRWSNLPGNQSYLEYNMTSKKYISGSFTMEYKPKFQIPASTVIYDPLKNEEWMARIRVALAKMSTTETKDDDTYGNDGKVTYTYKPFPGFSNIETETLEYKNEKGVVREEIYREYYNDGFMYEEVTYYDCDGKPVHFDSSVYDDYGYEIEYTEIEFENGEPISGYRDVFDEDEEGYYEYREYYNPDTDRFERRPYGIRPWIKYNNFSYDGPSRTGCNIKKNLVFLAGSLLSEDSNPRFNLYGGLINYTRFLNEKIGVTGEIGINFGSQYNTDYTKINILAGITYVPLDKAGLENCFTFSFHALAGIMSLKSESGMFSNSQSYFNAMIGPRFDYNFNNKFGIGAQAELNPVFPKGGGTVVMNYRFSTGVRFTF